MSSKIKLWRIRPPILFSFFIGVFIMVFSSSDNFYFLLDSSRRRFFYYLARVATSLNSSTDSLFSFRSKKFRFVTRVISHEPTFFTSVRGFEVLFPVNFDLDIFKRRLRSCNIFSHTSFVRGYMSRKLDIDGEEIEKVSFYYGRLGYGFIIDRPNYDSTRYFYRDFFLFDSVDKFREFLVYAGLKVIDF